MTTTEKYYTGEMSELNHEGDTRIMWDKDNKDEVKAARKQFDFLVKERSYRAFKAEGKKGEAGEAITEFDPELERIILMRQLAGG